MSNAPSLAISPDKVCFSVLKARELNVKDAGTDSDSGSNSSDHAMIGVPEDQRGDPTFQELTSFIDALTEDEQIDLVALTWLGRGDGTIDEWDPDHPGSLYKVSFGTYTMNLTMDPESRGRLAKKLKEMTFRELQAEERLLQRHTIKALPVRLEFHRRIASSFAALVFILFGLAIGLGHHHHERLVTFVWVLGLFIAYYLTAIGMNALALSDWLPAWLTMWMPNLMGLGLGAASVAKAARR